MGHDGAAMGNTHNWKNAEPNDLVKNMGKFKQDFKTPVSSYGKLQKESFELMKDAGWK